jgi:CCR4-NOT transcriptional regulation complex NOT5 subunit
MRRLPQSHSEEERRSAEKGAAVADGTVSSDSAQSLNTKTMAASKSASETAKRLIIETPFSTSRSCLL